MRGLLMARVSSQEQADGFSLQAQLKLGERYAEEHQIEIVHRWEVAESAKKQGRASFDAMIAYAKRHKDIQCLLFEKPDRMTRNFFDFVKVLSLIKEHGKEVHFFKTGKVMSEKSSEEDWMMFNDATTRSVNFIHNLKQETDKGVMEKVRQGHFPGLAPCGYKNDLATHTICECEPQESFWVIRAFELIRTRLYSLESCRAKLLDEGCPKRLLPWRSALEKWIRNPFYYGWFVWKSKLYPGKHPPLVSKDCWDDANDALSRKGKPSSRRQFNYGGLMVCGLCGCSITAEHHEKKSGKSFDYYRCTWNKGKCGNNRYYPERLIEERIREALVAIHIEDEFAALVVKILSANAALAATEKESHAAVLRQDLKRIKTRTERAYADKLDGKITEEFWMQQTNAWEEERARIENKLNALEVATPAAYLQSARRVLELSKRLPELAFSMETEKRRLLLSTLCQNWKLFEEKLEADYRIPWSLLAQQPTKQNMGG